MAEFYLHHRLSEYLDFFSENEFEPQSISVFLEKIKKEGKIRKVEFQQSFNRNLFFIDLEDGDKIKTEFTFFPFVRIEKKDKNLLLDELVRKAQIKFDNYLDPIQLGAQYMRAKDLKDFPKMLIDIKDNVWINFFINEAKKLSSRIIS